MNHHVERHRQGRVVPEHGCRDRIAHEQHVDSRALEEPRDGRIVRGEDGEPLAPLLAILQM
ncbi:hypothetical protein D3C83_176430 [compost metagenome]